MVTTLRVYVESGKYQIITAILSLIYKLCTKFLGFNKVDWWQAGIMKFEIRT